MPSSCATPPGGWCVCRHALASDADAIQQAQGAGHAGRAAALYLGELLPGYCDEWVLEHRSHLAAKAEAPAERAAVPAFATPPAATPPVARLSRYLTRLIGFDAAGAAPCALLAQQRLVVLRGPGGRGAAQVRASMSNPTVVAMTKGAAAEAAVAPSGTAAAAAAKFTPRQHGGFSPMLLFGLALLVMLGWQTWLLASERDALDAAHAHQQQTVDNAGKLHTSLDTLAADAQRLADGGNASAALLVAELKKHGVAINPQQAPAAPR